MKIGIIINFNRENIEKIEIPCKIKKSEKGKREIDIQCDLNTINNNIKSVYLRMIDDTDKEDIYDIPLVWIEKNKNEHKIINLRS